MNKSGYENISEDETDAGRKLVSEQASRITEFSHHASLVVAIEVIEFIGYLSE